MNAALSSLLVLIAVIASIPLVLWLVKRLSQIPGSARSGPLSMPASLVVGPHERIGVLKVGGRVLLVGVTAQSITLLTELDASIELPESPQAKGFDELLKRLQHKQKQR